MKSVLTIGLGAVAALSVTGAVLAVGSETSTAAQERIVTVSRGVVQTTASGSGSLAPARDDDLSFKTTGEIIGVYVKAGQHVHADQLLGRLDPTSAEAALAQAQADLQSAQDTLDNVGSSSSSKSTTGGATMSEAAAEAAVQSATLKVTSAQRALDATWLRAPRGGTIAAVDGSVGDQAGNSTFVTLVQLSHYKLQVALSESDIGKVKVGQAATVTVNAVDNEEFAAHVTHISVLPSSSSSSSSSTSTGADTSSSSSSSAVSYPVTLRLDQTTHKLKPGMSATADIVTARASGITVPTQALSGSTVTVVRNGGRSTRTVTTGVAGDSATQILSGLSVGDQVVIRSTTATATAGSASASQSRSNRIGLGGGFSGGFAGGAPPAGAGPPGR